MKTTSTRIFHLKVFVFFFFFFFFLYGKILIYLNRRVFVMEGMHRRFIASLSAVDKLHFSTKKQLIFLQKNIHLTLVISTCLTRSKNLVPVLTWKSNNR